MALALYRRYRPATFADVVGQEHVTEPLRTALAAGRINHAYLFSGPRGCGKTSSARIMARSLNCEQGPTPDPCGRCPSCVALAPEGPGSIDVVELDAASHGGVDDARDLRDRAFYAPAESRYRVFIIDEAHMVTTQGFNALLKIVEEPPEHLVFVFATTEPEKVLATIRSRTHHYPFRLLPPSTMRRLLEQVCADEQAQVEPAVYPLVIRSGGGSARDSLSVLDQLLAGAGDTGVTYARAVALLGVTDVALIDEMVSALAAQDGAAVFATVDRLIEAGHDPRRFASDLLARFRDLVLLRVAPEAARHGLVDAPEDQLRTMTDQAERLGAAGLTRFAEIVHTGLTEMRGATAPRLLLELLCARMLLPSATEDDGAVLHRLERLERHLTSVQPAAPSSAGGAEGWSGAVATAAPPPAAAISGSPAPPASPRSPARSQPPAPAPPESPGPAAVGSTAVGSAASGSAASGPDVTGPDVTGGVDAAGLDAAGQRDVAAVRRVWQALLDVVREQSRATQVLLSNATVSAVRGETLILTLPTTPLARRLGDDRNVELIKGALRTVLGVEWQVRCEPASTDPVPPGDQRQAPRARSGQRPPERPARSSGRRPPAPQGPTTSPEGAPPLPPEPPEFIAPPEPDDPGPAPRAAVPPVRPQLPDDDEALLAQVAESADVAESAVADRVPSSHQDPDDVAIQLLTEQLGARRIDP